MLKPIVVEYWQTPEGEYHAESSGYPISASGESLFQLKAQIAHQIRECFRTERLPAVYDLIPRVEPGSCRKPAGSERSLAPDRER